MPLGSVQRAPAVSVVRSRQCGRRRQPAPAASRHSRSCLDQQTPAGDWGPSPHHLSRCMWTPPRPTAASRSHRRGRHSHDPHRHHAALHAAHTQPSPLTLPALTPAARTPQRHSHHGRLSSTHQNTLTNQNNPEHPRNGVYTGTSPNYSASPLAITSVRTDVYNHMHAPCIDSGDV